MADGDEMKRESPMDRVLAHLDAHRPTERTMPRVRAYLDAMLAMEPAPADVTHAAIDLAGVPAELLTPATSDAGNATNATGEPGATGAILFLHGGGYCFGSPAGYRPLAARIAKAAGIQMYVLDYRLAPEHVFPAAIDDALAAWTALVARVGAADKIVVVGDSAGAGLGLALAQKLRAAGKPLPRAFAFLSPWIDVVGNGASIDSNAALDPIVSREKMATLAQMYLGDHDRNDPLVSAVHADLHGLPPMLVHMSSREVERDDITHFVALAKAAGVDAELKAWSNVLHVFQMFPAFPEAAESIAEIGAYARAQLSKNSASGIPGRARG